MPGTREGLPISAHGYCPAICRPQSGLRYFQSSDPHRILRPRTQRVSAFSHFTDQKVETQRKNFPRVSHPEQAPRSPGSWSFAFPSSFQPLPHPAPAESSMESKAGAVAAAGVENLPGWGSSQITTWLSHVCLCAPGDLAAASPPGLYPLEGGTQQPGAGYSISGPQVLVCKMGLIIPSLVRGLAIYM